ncbi:MAG: hypothetical protein AAF138_08525 [Planctomycetota bacterium]
MSKSDDETKALNQLLKQLKSEHGDATPSPPPEAPEDADPLLHQLVFSILLWETTSNQAATAHKRLLAAVVDYNELRICLPDDLVQIMGDRVAIVRERAVRLRSTLNAVYEREHALTLEPLASMGKREARTYLETLEGCPRFAAARVVMLELGGHAAPVDDRLHALLVRQGLIPDGADIDTATAWLERKIRAADGSTPFHLLEAWREASGSTPRKRDSGAFAFSRAETAPPAPAEGPTAPAAEPVTPAAIKAGPSKSTAKSKAAATPKPAAKAATKASDKPASKPAAKSSGKGTAKAATKKTASKSGKKVTSKATSKPSGKSTKTSTARRASTKTTSAKAASGDKPARKRS